MKLRSASMLLIALFLSPFAPAAAADSDAEPYVIESYYRVKWEQMPRPSPKARKRAKAKARTARKDPLFVDGKRPRPMYVDYKDLDLLKKLVNRHGRIVGRRKTGCSAASQHAVTEAIKRARFMALLPYTSD